MPVTEFSFTHDDFSLNGLFANWMTPSPAAAPHLGALRGSE